MIAFKFVKIQIEVLWFRKFFLFVLSEYIIHGLDDPVKLLQESFLVRGFASFV